MRLGRSFFNLYFIVILSFILFSWLLDEVWNSYVEQDVESYTGYQVMLKAVGDYLQKSPKDEWQSLVKRASDKYALPLQLVSHEKVSSLVHLESISETHRENIFIHHNDGIVQLFHPIENSLFYLVLGPAEMPTRPRLEAIVRIGALSIIGLLLLIWLWPLSKDLDNLKRSTQVFGEGNFDVKSPQSHSSMMAPLVNSFNMMSTRIKQLIEAQKELTNAVAHELRTPLARSKFALQMLETTKDEEKKQQYIQQINNDNNELEELINEMLAYASFDNDKPVLTFEPVELGNIIECHVEKQSHYSGNITFNNQLTVNTVECDKHFIERAFINYLTNAQKYGKDSISITLGEVNEQYQLSVSDNGKGVPDSQKLTLFDAFTRGEESRNKEIKGFGLGLAIVRRIMEWHQGRAWVEDNNEGGATFILQWPKK